MHVNIIKREDGTYDISKDRKGAPGVDVVIAEKSYRKLRRADQAFDYDATCKIEFAYAIGIAAHNRPKLEHEVALEIKPKPVIAPERAPWRHEGRAPLHDDGQIHHRKCKPNAKREVIPVQVSCDRVRSTWNAERFAAIAWESTQDGPKDGFLWDSDEHKLSKRLNRIKPGHTLNDKHLAATGDLMSLDRWLYVSGVVIGNRVRWGNDSDTFDMSMSATIELLELHAARSR